MESQNPLLVVQSDSNGSFTAVVGLAFAVANPIRNADEKLAQLLGKLGEVTLQLWEDERPEVQERAAWALAELSAVKEIQSVIAQNLMVMTGLARFITLDCKDGTSPGAQIQIHAARALGNLASLEDNISIFKQSISVLPGLVQLLFKDCNLIAREMSAQALANISFWTEGARMIADTPGSLAGLVRLVNVGNGGQEAATLALANLAKSPATGWRILDCPDALPALARLLNAMDADGFSDPAEQAHAQKIARNASVTMARMSSSRLNAQKMATSLGFRLALEYLVEFLLRPEAGEFDERDEQIRRRKLRVQAMVAVTVANLSVAEEAQIMMANFPGALAALLKSMLLRHHESGGNITPEYAVAALEHLARAKGNRMTILTFWNGAIVTGLTNLLFHDEFPCAQEVAARTFANLSQHSGGTMPAVIMAKAPNLLQGLVRLLKRGSCRPAAHNHVVRAFANLTHPYENRARIAQVPGAVKALVALLSRDENPHVQEHAAKACGYLACAQENWESEHISEAIRGLVTLLPLHRESLNIGAQLAAHTLGTFALSPRNHGEIVHSQDAAGLAGLVAMLNNCKNPGGHYQAAVWTLCNLAELGDEYTKAAIAGFPFAVSALLELLKKYDYPRVQEHARRTIACIADHLDLIIVNDVIVGTVPTMRV